MQGQRNSFESIPESLQFDCGSISNSSAMDQPFYESNLLLNPVETPTLADYLLSPNDTDMDYLNIPPQSTDGMDIWNSHDSSSSAYIANQENHDSTKMDHGWNTVLSINSVGSTRMEEGCYERSNNVSLENVDFNLNNTPADDGQTFRQNLNSSHVTQGVDHNVHPGPHNEITEVSLCPFLPEYFDHEHVTYSNSHESSSSAVGLFSDNDNRARCSVDSQRIACKRKVMEGVTGESSTSNISADLGTPSSSRYLPASFLGDHQNPSFNPMHRGLCSDWSSSSTFSGNAETSQRNLRARYNSVRQHDPSPFQSHSSVTNDRLSSIWSCGEAPTISNLFNHSPEQIQRHLLASSLSPNVNRSTSSSRIGSSSFPAYAQPRLIATPEETNIRSLPRNDNVDQTTLLTRTTLNQLAQDRLYWNPSNSSSSLFGNRASNSSGVIPSTGSIRTPSDIVSPQFHRNLSDIFRSSLFPSSGSEPGRSTATLEPGQSPGTVLHGHSPLYPRAALSVDRQRDAVSGLNVPARSRDGRSRMISEIRNALDLMRRGVNLRLEDVFIFDHSGFYGRADLYDRHRDMRLDVDNMSYEELLALEERIGYVNTGLNEETISKCLRQRKFLPCNLEVASVEEEPCCICREDYSEGEDISTLDCKHDFHTACIKQWLMSKNLCPICKTTALAT